MENDYRITKLHGTFIGDNRIPDLPAGEKTKVFSSTNGKTAWVDLPDGGEIEVIDGTVISAQGNETEFTIETEPQGKVFLQKGLYNSVLYGDSSAGPAEFYSMYFPETAAFFEDTLIFSKYNFSTDATTETLAISSLSSYGLRIGEKSADGTYPITIEKGELELIEVSNGVKNADGSYTYTLPNKPSGNSYILKTVDSDGASYYLMTGDSDVSFGMRPIALTDSFFGGNFMVVSGTTATQRPTNFPPQPKSADNGKVLTVNNGYPSWETVGGATPVVEVTLNEDSSITLPEAQTTNFIIHSEELGYIYVNNINGTYSAIIPVGKDIAYVLTGTETTVTLSFPILLNMVEGTAGELVDGKVSISIPSSHDFPFLLNIDRQGIFYISAYENNSNEIVYEGVGARKDNAGNNQLAIFSGKGTNITMEVVPLGGGSSTSIAFQDVTVSELANHVGKFENLHITDLMYKYTIGGYTQTFTGAYFIGSVVSDSTISGELWFTMSENTVGYLDSGTFSISNNAINYNQGTSLGVIKSLPWPLTIHSSDGFKILWETIDGGDVIYEGNVKGKIGNYSLALAYTSLGKLDAQGEETFATLTGLFEGYGYGVMELKKDANNIPQFKSFTTWLPPVTSADEGKSLVVTEGNAQWTTTPRYEHTITIKNSAGKILWTQTMRNSSNTVVNSYANLKTLFGEATYAGYGEYCQLDLHGGTEATDKLIKADGTEATLASLGAIVYTDVCFLPK